jgi:uncharacterized membrane protein YphA (DoxX/SURF4 family)
MKPRDYSLLAARVLVGTVLVYAGASKAAGPSEEFANIIVSYGLIGADLARPLAAFLPWIELAVGWALLLGVEIRTTAAVSVGLFAMFIFAIGHAIAIGIPLTNCGCFGDGVHIPPKLGLLLDAGFAALSFLCWRRGAGALSLEGWAERGA